MSTTSVTPVKPVYLAPLVDTNRRLAREWLPWVQGIGVTEASVTTLQTSVTALQKSLASGTASSTTLSTQLSAAQAALATVEAEIAALQTASSSTSATVEFQTLEINLLKAANTPLGYVPLNPALNLSDVLNAATARLNLGITTGGSSNESVMVNFVTCSDDYSWSVNQPPQITVNTPHVNQPNLITVNGTSYSSQSTNTLLITVNGD